MTLLFLPFFTTILPIRNPHCYYRGVTVYGQTKIRRHSVSTILGLIGLLYTGECTISRHAECRKHGKVKGGTYYFKVVCTKESGVPAARIAWPIKTVYKQLMWVDCIWCRVLADLTISNPAGVGVGAGFGENLMFSDHRTTRLIN